jgi:2-polyprenyl-6-methoxyphenol hydroxylase-like FAD-dependent oxidoreductase
MEPNVLIIGAGMTGLCIAHGLEQAGTKHTIFDSEDGVRFRPKEWTMGIHWGLPLLESLLPPHLAKRIPTDGSVDGFLDYSEPPNNGAYIFDGVTGEVLKDLTVDGRIVRVSRRRIRALCREDVEVKWSHTLESARCNDDDNTVTATFTNGQSYTGTLLVGCDGPRSVVRSHLFDEPSKAQAKTMEGCVNISMVISYPAETARYVRSKTHPVWCMAISPGIFTFMSLQDVPDPDKPETWKFFLMMNWLGEGELGLSNEDRIKALKERGEKLAEVCHCKALNKRVRLILIL